MKELKMNKNKILYFKINSLYVNLINKLKQIFFLEFDFIVLMK